MTKLSPFVLLATAALTAGCDLKEPSGAAPAKRSSSSAPVVRPLEKGATGQHPIRIEPLRPAGERDLHGEAAALRRRGEEAKALGEYGRAADFFEQALAIVRAAGDREAEGRLLNEAGAAYRGCAELDRAGERFGEALEIARAGGYLAVEAKALSHLADLHATRGETQQVIDRYQQAAALFRQLGMKSEEAAVYYGLGSYYALLAEYSEALNLLRRGLRIYRDLEDAGGEALLLLGIGWTHYLAGKPGLALLSYDWALDRYRRLGNEQGEAVVLDRRGTALRKMGEPDQALAFHRKALAVVWRRGDLTSVHHTLANIGHDLHARGDDAQALKVFGRALPFFRKVRNRNAEVGTLLGVARAERRLGRPDAAEAHLQQILRIVESLRAEVAGSADRAYYFAVRHEAYELYVDLLMERHRREPGRDYARRAFEISERARARSLLEDLVGPGARRALAADPEPLGLAEIQQILDDDTLLLQFALGKERSYLWAVGPDSLRSHVLPEADRIANSARRLHGLLSASRERRKADQAQAAAAHLADLILAPVAGELGQKRLVISADGPLQYVPFAFLRVDAGQGRRFLVEDHEIVEIPSASVVAKVRQVRAGRPMASRDLGIMADAVFGPDDERLRCPGCPSPAAPIALAADLERAAKEAGIEDFRRLVHSGREAEVIYELARKGRSWKGLGFAADRDTVLAGRLSPFRWLHFASHGFLNAEHPELSGIVLSRVDEQGRPRDGFLHAREIANLDLRAELVVLSACQTALGKEVRGEGLMSLTRAFLQAGAAGVVVSRWNVSDRGTAELMERFYHGLLKEGLPPSAALRQAQLEMLREPPYYWAPFSLQGDWR